MGAPLDSALAAHGLVVFGRFAPTAEDRVPDLADGSQPGAVVVIGNVGSAIWPVLQAAPEMREADPLDRWTRRVVDTAASAAGGEAVFPFGGPPHHPFQRWAQRADPAFRPSPLGLLIHPEYGLWTALRAAVLLRDPAPAAAGAPAPHPCESCVGRPCLSACPVNAFRDDRYVVADCLAHLGTLSSQACTMQGCLARRACPVGRNHAYEQAHAAFHMRAFRRSAPLN